MTKIKIRLSVIVTNRNPNPNPNSPIQSFREFISDFTKSLISQIYCNTHIVDMMTGEVVAWMQVRTSWKEVER